MVRGKREARTFWGEAECAARGRIVMECGKGARVRKKRGRLV